MNRRILLLVTAPAVLIGLLLCGTCIVGAWSISRLQANTANILSQSVTGLQAAQELEISVRQLRFHCFLYLIDPKPERLTPINADQQRFEQALQAAKESAGTAEERTCVSTIEAGYQHYREELGRLRQQAAPGTVGTDLGGLFDSHPVRHVVEPCQELLRLSKNAMLDTSRQSETVSQQAYLAMLLIGIVGPFSGLVTGVGIARGLSRSICRLSVRIQDVAQRLDQDVTSVSLVADGDIQAMDKQLQEVVVRVEEVAERMQRHQRDMLRAEQLAAVGQLAASVAHEVRNPVTAIKLLVDLALHPRNPKPLTADDLRVIQREATRLEQTVQGFLDFARLPTPRRARRDLREIVGQAVELVQARARQQKVDVVVHCPEAPVVAFVDGDQLQTVLVNLCLNALDAMPMGGRLEIDLDTSAAEGFCLSVADSGGGISPEIADRLFTPFASTKPTGTGLGLSLSRRIIEEHGGSLAALNRPEGGACFTIRVPAGAAPGFAPTPFVGVEQGSSPDRAKC